MVHAQLANVLSTEALFYACILPFIAFFGAFAFIMYPLRDVLHPTGKLNMSSLQHLPIVYAALVVSQMLRSCIRDATYLGPCSIYSMGVQSFKDAPLAT